MTSRLFVPTGNIFCSKPNDHEQSSYSKNYIVKIAI